MRPGRWSRDRARNWAGETGWLVGCNYLPSYAVNFIDFWQRDRFDAQIISRELALAASTGLNSVRVGLSYLVWRNERDEHLRNIDHFLQIAAGLNIGVVLVPFDDCQFSGQAPEYGPQPAPIPNIHNGRAAGSPGRERVLAWRQEPEIETYFKVIVERYADDGRVLYWDLYNEPGNRGEFANGVYHEFDSGLEAKSLELLGRCFDWARSIDPVQPLSVAAWRTPQNGETETAYDNAIDRFALAHSDVISIHAYVPLARMQNLVGELRRHERPLIVSEWLARPLGSRIEEQLPLFADNDIGCFHWGLVNGRTQTHLPWPYLESGTEEWFHDLYHSDYRAYDPAEIELFVAAANRRACPDEA